MPILCLEGPVDATAHETIMALMKQAREKAAQKETKLFPQHDGDGADERVRD